MAKLTSEELVNVATNSEFFGYRSRALFDLDAFNEEQLAQYLLSALICMTKDQSQLSLEVLADNATKNYDSFLFFASTLATAKLYPPVEAKTQGKENETLTQAAALVGDTGLPLAILTLLEEKTTKEVIATIATPGELDPQPLLALLARLATLRNRDSSTLQN